jgi:hypothetical protein
VGWLGIMRPDDWAIGMLGYQSFAIGGSDAGGPATSTYLQPFISLGGRYYLASSADGASDFGGRAQVSLC